MRHQNPTNATEDRGKAEVATDLQRDWFSSELEQDPTICNNCFAPREKKVSHFRTMGGSGKGGGLADQTADMFCTTCYAGTGKPSLHTDYGNVGGSLRPETVSEMAGTVGRNWCEKNPLPKNGETVSFGRCLRNIKDRLLEKGYDVDWDRARQHADELKNQHPNRDRAIFAAVLCEWSRQADLRSANTLVDVKDLGIA